MLLQDALLAEAQIATAHKYKDTLKEISLGSTRVQDNAVPPLLEAFGKISEVLGLLNPSGRVWVSLPWDAQTSFLKDARKAIEMEGNGS